MLTLSELKSLKARNFSFIGMAAINAAIEKAEAAQAAAGVPGASLAAQRAAIILAENNAPAIIAAEKALQAAEAALQVELAAQQAADAAKDSSPELSQDAQDAQIIAQGERDTDTVSDPEGMQ